MTRGPEPPGDRAVFGLIPHIALPSGDQERFTLRLKLLRLPCVCGISLASSAISSTARTPPRGKDRRDVRLRARKDANRAGQPRAYRYRIPKRRSRIWTVQRQPICFRHDCTAPVLRCARRGRNHSALRESIPARHAVADILAKGSCDRTLLATSTQL